MIIFTETLIIINIENKEEKDGEENKQHDFDDFQKQNTTFLRNKC